MWCKVGKTHFVVIQEAMDIMFRGVHHQLDAKGRMAVPARQREQLSVICEGQMVMTVDTQSSCLALYPLPEWERIERDVQALPALNPAIKRFQRLVLGYASDLQLDGNGRVLVPPCAEGICAAGKARGFGGTGQQVGIVVGRALAERV
jgi:MraZ protein